MKKNGMSNDLDKLAAEMRKIKSSKKSRQSAMDAAMSAFSQEFSAEANAADLNISASESALDSGENRELKNNFNGSQGFADEPRPTGQTTRETRVQTFGRQTMSKFNQLINFKPQTMMMAGTCAAALIAGMIFVPNILGTLSSENAPLESVQMAESESADLSVETATARRTEVAALSPEILNQPNVVVIERHVLKTPGRVERRTVPAQFGEIERRTLVKPERAEWVEHGPDPKTGAQRYSRQILPAEYESRKEKVVLRQASEELAKIPPVYETVKETIRINADGSTETLMAEVVPNLGSAKAVTPTVEDDVIVVTGSRAETVRDSAATAKVAPAPTSPAPPKKQGGIGSIDSLLNDIGQNSDQVRGRNSARFDTLEQRADQQTQTAEQKKQQALASLARQHGLSSGHSSGPATSRNSGEKSAAAALPLPEAAPGFTAAPPSVQKIAPAAPTIQGGTVNTQTRGQFTVFNGVSHQVVESTETIVNQTGEVLCRVLIPARYKTITKQVVISPARTIERQVPAVTKEVTVKVNTEDGGFKEVTTTIVVKEAYVDQEVIPAKYETRSERVLVELSREEWKPGSQAINASALGVKPAAITRPAPIVRPAPPPAPKRDQFEDYESNPVITVEDTPVSTFSVDVDTASYSFMRASVNGGYLPPRGAVRLEEMINYFPYNYEAPKTADEPFKANVTVTPNPWNADTKLMHIGIKGYVPKETERLRNNLVFLIDTSGSMNQANKLPLLINSFKLLLETLDEDDTVSIVVYASASGTVLEPTSVRNKDDIIAALNKLRANGSTAGAAGLQLAYENAEKNFDDEGNNRVILATDGDFNVGFSSPDEMKTFISKKRETGISLSVLGFGQGNYNDHLMQALAQNGNGTAAYIDTLDEAKKVLANESGSGLMTIAKDVKIQVEFNPSVISEYRLIGYETRALKRKDFNNDKVDAGEIGAGHTVTAIYEMTPVNSPANTVDRLRYVSDKLNIKSSKSDEYAFVKIRHKLPNADKSTLQTFPINKRQEKSLKKASNDMRFAIAVAAVGQKLRGDEQLEGYSYKDAIKLASKARGFDTNGYRKEFIELVKSIEKLDQE